MQTNLTRLDEREIDEVSMLPEEEKTRFEINDLGTATWAFRKLRAYEKKMEEINEVADAEITRINEWRDREIKGITDTIEYFQNLLGLYYARQREADPKFKLTTPYGSVSSRKLQPKWELQNDTLLKWLKENGHADLIRVKEEPALSDIKDTFKVAENGVVTDKYGLIVDGVTVIDQGAKITVKTKGD